MLERARSFISSNSTIRRTREFLNSEEYPPLVALGVFIGYVAEIEVFSVLLFVLITAYGIVISKDLKCVLPALMLVPYSFNLAHTPGIPTYSDYYMQGWVVAIFATALAALAVGTVLHYLLWGGAKRTFLERNCLSPYIFVLAAGLLLNGVGAEGYNAHDFLTGLTLVAFWILLYMAFRGGLNSRKSTVEYYCVVCQWVAILLICQLILIYLTRDVIRNGEINGDRIRFGWGIHNNIGGTLALLIPPVFYLGIRRKHSWWSLLLAVVMVAAVYLTTSRSSLLGAVLAFLVCLIAACFVGKNKMLYRTFAVALTTCGVFFLFLFGEKLYDVIVNGFFDSFSDSGRFGIWEKAMQNFLDYPFLGAGFHASPWTSWAGRKYGYCHNTIVQILSAGGILLFGGYVAVRIKTLWITLNRITIERAILGISIAVLLLMSLLDNHMFNIYPTFFYSVSLALIELNYTSTVSEDARRRFKLVELHGKDHT